MSLARASWIVVVVLCAMAAAGSFLAGYAGYGATVIAVGLAAAVNLWPRPEIKPAEPADDKTV